MGRGLVSVVSLVGILAACGRRNFNDADAGGGEPPIGDANRMFVTAAVHTGALGGLAGADAICTAAAIGVGLPGTYVAWLSTSTVPAATRLASARGWVRTDGEIVIDRPTELTSTGPRVPMSFTEEGVDLRGLGGGTVFAYTGSTGQGQAVQPTCLDWADGTSVEGGLVGIVTSGNGEFAANSAGSPSSCSTPEHLYCFGIDRVAVLGEPPPAPSPRAFVSRGAFAPTTTRPVADAMCATEAAEAGLPGVFLAALPLTGESAASRFTATAVYHRTDGVRLGRILSDTVPATFLNRHADGALASPSAVWTGGQPGRIPPDSDTCASWSAGTVGGTVGRSVAGTASMFKNTTGISCTVAAPVYCLER